MNTPDTEFGKLTKLRRDAEALLKTGEPPASQGWWVDGGALGSIHKLANSPASAPDALKLLHEVQVYQVELDLQHEEMEAAQRDLAERAAQWETLYEFAPVAYVTLSPRYEIVECNHAAATLLGAPAEDLRGRTFSSFVAPVSGSPLPQWLEGLRRDGGSDACDARLLGGGARQRVQVIARCAPGGHAFLVVVVNLPESE